MEPKGGKTYSYHSGTLVGSNSKQGETLESPSFPSLETQGEESEGLSASECGVPFIAQHLVVNFAPNERVDCDITQKKCCDFWEFIRSQHELKRLMALPDVDMYTSLKKSESEMMSWSMQSGRPGEPSEGRPKEPSERRPGEPSGPSERRLGELPEERPGEGKGHMWQHVQKNTAVSMLECVEKKDIYEWCDVEAPISSYTSRCHAMGEEAATSATCGAHGYVHALCHELMHWDQIHPKNFSPPEVSSDFYKLDNC